MMYVVFGLAACILSYGLTLVFRSLALHSGIVDNPQSAPERKFQSQPTPLLGGWPIYLSVLSVALVSLALYPRLIDSFLSVKNFIGIFLAGLLIVVGGTIDDKKRLSPFTQLLFPIIATLVIIASGIGITYITNPIGGVIMLDRISVTIFSFNQTPFSIVLFADLLVFGWLLVSMYATKLLDGIDGLSSGIGVIGSLLLFTISCTKLVNQPGTALFAVIVAGALFGFWLHNRPKASIYLGEGGSLLVGFFLGLLAVISGAKIATALLILALPLLDILWVVLSRTFRRVNIFNADRSHLHFRLLDRGLTQKKVLAIYYSIALIFGASALVLSSLLKLLFLIVASVVALLLLLFALKKT